MGWWGGGALVKKAKSSCLGSWEIRTSGDPAHRQQRRGSGLGFETPGAGSPGRTPVWGGPRRGEGRLTEIDVSEGAAADLPAQPVPVPHSKLHGGGGGTGLLLPSRPLPGSELGEAKNYQENTGTKLITNIKKQKLKI